jgi:hypothetical protein
VGNEIPFTATMVFAVKPVPVTVSVAAMPAESDVGEMLLMESRAFDP